MKKLLMVFIAVVIVSTFLEKGLAQGCKFDNFFLEHSQQTIRPERFTMLEDYLMINAEENLGGEGNPTFYPEFISPSHLIDQDTQYKTSDGFDINLERLSEDMEQFGLTFKVTKLDSAYKEPDDNYFEGFNYSFALSYKF